MVLAISIVYFLIEPQRNVPEGFYDARDRSEGLAETIQQLTRQSLTRLAQIAEFDEQGNASAALNLISQEISEHRKSQEIAAQLGSQMEIMARLISDIKPAAARDLAAESVSAGVALVSRLVTYNQLLGDLFGVLQLKMINLKNDPSLDGRVNLLVNQINDQAKAINQFNQRINSATAKFNEAIQ